MLESMFYNIWNETISQRWRTLTERMAKIAWNQHHSKLVSIPDDACKNACEKLVCTPDMKYAPQIDDIIKRIIHENAPKVENPFENDDQSYTRPSPQFEKIMAVARRVANGDDLVRKLKMYEMLPGIWQDHGVTVSQKDRIDLTNRTHRAKAALEQQETEAPQRKAEAAHAKKLTRAEWIARMKRKRAEKSTLGNALGRVLK